MGVMSLPWIGQAVKTAPERNGDDAASSDLSANGYSLGGAPNRNAIPHVHTVPYIHAISHLHTSAHSHEHRHNDTTYEHTFTITSHEHTHTTYKYTHNDTAYAHRHTHYSSLEGSSMPKLMLTNRTNLAGEQVCAVIFPRLRNTVRRTRQRLT